MSPNEIKFYFQYALFLRQIVNNEQEAQALFDKASHIFQMIISIKTMGTNGKESSTNATEYGLYGENTAVGVIMVALEAEKVGTVIHINEEIQRTLGHQKKNVVGKKVNSIQPAPICLVHDRILRRFLDSAKTTVLNHNLQLFALTSEGYLRPIFIIVKLYP